MKQHVKTFSQRLNEKDEGSMYLENELAQMLHKLQYLVDNRAFSEETMRTIIELIEPYLDSRNDFDERYSQRSLRDLVLPPEDLPWPEKEFDYSSPSPRVPKRINPPQAGDNLN